MINKLTIKFIAGTSIFNAVLFAEEIAKKYNTEVEFRFNNDIYSGGMKFVKKTRFDLEFVKVAKE